MTRNEEKILKILGEYIGGEVDVDDLFYENICTSDMEMSELITILDEQNVSVPHALLPMAQEFNMVQDFVNWVVDKLEK